MRDSLRMHFWSGSIMSTIWRKRSGSSRKKHAEDSPAAAGLIYLFIPENWMLG